MQVEEKQYLWPRKTQNRTKEHRPTMNEIRIYHSPWRMLLLIAGCFVFIILSVDLIQGSHQWLGYTTILFFGICGLYLLTAAVKEYVFRRPYITVTDEHIVLQRWKTQTIRLEDVETFKVARTGDQKFVAVIYTPEAKRRIKKESGAAGKALRALNSRLTTQKDALEYIPVTGTAFSAQELCDLLNCKLSQSDAV